MKLITESAYVPENFTGIAENNGHKIWYKNGKLHREDGPACEYTNGTKYWYKNGKLHREDGPAVEDADGKKFWYLNDIKYSEQEFNEKMKPTLTCNGKVVIIDGKKYKLVEET